MKISIHQEGMSRFNMIIVLFLTYIMSTYKYGEFVHYIMFIVLAALILKMLTEGIKKSNKISISKSVLTFCVIVLVFFLFRSILNLDELKAFFKNYSVIYFVFFYSLLKFYKNGAIYGEQFFIQFTKVLNALSILNLIQIILHKPLLYKFFTEQMDNYQYWAYGTGEFRPVSVFGHPIVSAVFFSLLVICNFYILKGNLKYPLQLLAIVNVYATQSRSAWIALAIIIGMYFIKNFRIKKFKKNVRITYNQWIKIYVSLAIVICGIGLLVLSSDSIISSIIERFGDSLSRNSTDISNLQRTGTLHLINSYMLQQDMIRLVFGYGLGTVGDFMYLNTVVIPNFTTTDNMYLTFFFELGILSLFSYGLFLIMGVIRFFLSRNYWLSELGSLCFIFISIIIFFFEGIGWGTVAIVWSFSLLTIIIKFKNPKDLTNKQNEMV
ncbi:O-antigen ligase family protein [Bacillus cereus]|uniref:O-antigen ligase family protein n=1 Tax=Bacillus cereus TaxID=1396 RepID=UPI0018F3CD0B|nr:O-antigen ligase family protein [Bacillus cereus]